MLRNDRLVLTMAQLWRVPELELEMCYQRGICPDCAQQTLDTTHPITCRNPQCGSRFDRDARGKWNRI
jgi:hypothetical protein